MSDNSANNLHAGACLITQGSGRGFVTARSTEGTAERDIRFHRAFSHHKGSAWARGGKSARRDTECSNCGDTTHMFRSCPHPITSIGIVAVRWPLPSSAFEILMIQRKDSLGYVELLRGKYDVSDIQYIIDLMSEMTRDELTSMQTRPFDELWDLLWNRQASRQYKQEYEASKAKWNTLLTGITDSSGGVVTLAELITRVTTPDGGWPTPEWGFPKGRRNARESDLHCAIREFQEETGLTDDDFTVMKDIAPLQETFVGSNKVRYSHKYYVAVCKPDCAVRVDTDNSVQRREVGDIRWVSPTAGICLIRPYDTTKHDLVHRIEATLATQTLVHTSP